jgi:cell division protein FtsB
MSKEELTQQKEMTGKLKLIDKIVIGLILVAVYSVFAYLFFHANRLYLSTGKPKVLITK